MDVKPPQVTKNDKPVKENKKKHGSKDRGEARKLNGEDEKNVKKETEVKQNKKSEVADNKKKETPKIDDGKKKESLANDVTKKMEEVKLEKKKTNEFRRSKISVAPLNEGVDQDHQKRRPSSMIANIHNKVIRDIHRRSSTKFNRLSTLSTIKDYPKASDPLRSIHSSSSTSTFSSGKTEIYGFFSADDCIDSFKIGDKSIMISRIEQDGTITEMTAKKFENTPIFMCLVSDQSGKPHLVVIEEKTFMLTIMKTGKQLKIEKVHEQKVDDYISDPLPIIVSSYDPINSCLVIQVARSFITLISFVGEIPVVKRENCKEYHPQCLVWMSSNKENAKLISAKKGFDEVGNKKIHYEECTFDKKNLTLSERVDLTKNLHSGHLVLIPEPLHGVVIMGKKYISFFDNSNSDPVTNQLTQQDEIKYKYFAMLGNNKILFVDNQNLMYLTRLVVEREESTQVLLFDTQIIKKDIKIKNLFAINEFLIMLQIEDDTWKFGYLSRQKPSIKYILEIEDKQRENDNEPIASPPLKAGHGQPIVVAKPGVPDIGDVLNDRWEVVKKLGEGSYGTIHIVQDVQKKMMYVLKTQRIIPKEPSITNELAFLKRIKTLKDKTGFPELIDEFVWFGKWHLFILSNEGKSLLDFVNMNSCKKFSESNLLKIRYQATKILLKMHEIGFIHRDFHVENVLVKMTSNKSLVLTAIDYGFTMREKDTKPQKFMCHAYASLDVCNGKRSKKKDDLFSMHCILMVCGGMSKIFNITDNEELKKMKKNFDEDPSKYFASTQKWMATVYNSIKNIPSEDKEPASTLLKAFDEGTFMKNVNPRSEIEYTKTNFIDFNIN